MRILRFCDFLAKYVYKVIIIIIFGGEDEVGENRHYRVMIRSSWKGASIYRMPAYNSCDYVAHDYVAYEFFCDPLKKELLSVLFRIAHVDNLPGNNTTLGELLIEDINFDLIELLAAADITKDEEFRGKVKGYLAGDTELEEFHKDVVAYHMAEKLSQ